MNTKRLLLSVTLLLSINVCIVLYLLNTSSLYNIKITNKYHVIYNNNFDFAVDSAVMSPSTKDSMIPTFVDKISLKTSTDKISMETSTDKISLKTSTDKISLKTSTDKVPTFMDKISLKTSTDKVPTFMDKISTETNKNLMETENQLLLDYDYNKKNETGLPYIFERMFTFFIYSL